MRLLVVLAMAVGCSAENTERRGGKKNPGKNEPITEQEEQPPEPLKATISDLGPESGLDGAGVGLRSRALIVADFDLDGRQDVFSGNPGDDSFILLNKSSKGSPKFELGPILHTDGYVAWTAAAADYDNDGDMDLYIGGGGNECAGEDVFWHNNLIETGKLAFVQRTVEAQLTQPKTILLNPNNTPTTGVRWADVNQDGWVDLYVGRSISGRCGVSPTGANRNVLWINNQNGTFTEQTKEAGLITEWDTRHPTLLDFDNDGDIDIYDNNFKGTNLLWANMLNETGSLTYGLRNGGFVANDKVDIGAPDRGFASCAGDFDNNGFEDLIIFERHTSECSLITDEDLDQDAKLAMHTIFENLDGHSVRDATYDAGLFVFQQPSGGVMGCQLGDVDGDGSLDVYVGNGGPRTGAPDELFFGSLGEVKFTNHSKSIDFQSTKSEASSYRTHGTVITDVDGDRIPEILVAEGGPSALENEEEPNRLFKFDWETPPDFLEVHLKGDGNQVSLDAIGTKVWVNLVDADGTERSVYRVLYGGSCFSAQNGFILSFGLAQSTPVSMGVRWPNGSEERIDLLNESEREYLLTYRPIDSKLSVWKSSF